MTEEQSNSEVPALIETAVASIPKYLVPNSVKALDRLVGAAVDIPVAWLAQQKAKLDAQTAAFQAVESAIGSAAASQAASDPAIVSQALSVLARKSYRKHKNVEVIAQLAVENLQSDERLTDESATRKTDPEPLEDDWLNVFERYAEDATSERMQELWGRVLAGQIRKPGRYSLRTLRFLSEFSQSDGQLFAEFSKHCFGNVAPIKLVKPTDGADISNLLTLEASGLISDPAGKGLGFNLRFDDGPVRVAKEGTLAIIAMGAPNTTAQAAVISLTPLAQELVSLLPGRNPLEAARTVAHAIRRPEMTQSLLVHELDDGSVQIIEVLWESTPTERTES